MEDAKVRSKKEELRITKKVTRDPRLQRCRTAGRCDEGAGVYWPKTFLISPTLRWILPPVFSTVPRSSRSRLPVARPAFSFTLPLTSWAAPLILSFVLDFILVNRAPSRRRTEGV